MSLAEYLRSVVDSYGSGDSVAVENLAFYPHIRRFAPNPSARYFVLGGSSAPIVYSGPYHGVGREFSRAEDPLETDFNPTHLTVPGDPAAAHPPDANADFANTWSDVTYCAVMAELNLMYLEFRSGYVGRHLPGTAPAPKSDEAFQILGIFTAYEFTLASAAMTGRRIAFAAVHVDLPAMSRDDGLLRTILAGLPYGNVPAAAANILEAAINHGIPVDRLVLARSALQNAYKRSTVVLEPLPADAVPFGQLPRGRPFDDAPLIIANNNVRWGFDQLIAPELPDALRFRYQ